MIGMNLTTWKVRKINRKPEKIMILLLEKNLCVKKFSWLLKEFELNKEKIINWLPEQQTWYETKKDLSRHFVVAGVFPRSEWNPEYFVMKKKCALSKIMLRMWSRAIVNMLMGCSTYLFCLVERQMSKVQRWMKKCQKRKDFFTYITVSYTCELFDENCGKI